MKRLRVKTALIVVAFATVSLVASTTTAAIPSDVLLQKLQPQGDVSDYADILSGNDRTVLENRLAELRQRTSAQFAVVILKSLEGGEIDDFTNKLFVKWGVGLKEKNNGVMLLVALQDRKARIEVGYGLEPILPDALAGRVLEEQLFPAFKRQHYIQGLVQATNRIAEIVERNEPATAKQRNNKATQQDNALALVLLFPFVATGFGALGAGIAKRQGFIVLFGLLLGGIPLLITFIASEFDVVVSCCLIALIASIVGGNAACRAPTKNFRRKQRGHSWAWTSVGSGAFLGSSGGGFGGGGFGGSGGFGGGFSGGGGFGGGCSGGGGASGGW